MPAPASRSRRWIVLGVIVALVIGLVLWLWPRGDDVPPAKAARANVPSTAESAALSAKSPPEVSLYEIEQHVTLTLSTAEDFDAIFGDKSQSGKPARKTVASQTSFLLRGQLEVLVASIDDNNWQTERFRFRDNGSSLAGADVPCQAAEAVRGYLNDFEFWVVIDGDGLPRRVLADKNMPDELAPFAFMMLDLVTVSSPPGRDKGWNGKEQDSLGLFLGLYRLVATENGIERIEKRRRYVSLYSTATVEFNVSDPKNFTAKGKDLTTEGKSELLYDPVRRRLVAADGSFSLKFDHPIATVDSTRRDHVRLLPPGGFAAKPPPADVPAHIATLKKLDLQALNDAQAERDASGIQVDQVDNPEAFNAELEALLARLLALKNLDSPEGRALLAQLARLMQQSGRLCRSAFLKAHQDGRLNQEIIPVLVEGMLRHGGLPGQSFAATMAQQSNLTEKTKDTLVNLIGTTGRLGPEAQAFLLNAAAGRVPNLPPNLRDDATLMAGLQAYDRQLRMQDDNPYWEMLKSELRAATNVARIEVVLVAMGNVGHPESLALAEPFFQHSSAAIRIAACVAISRVRSEIAVARVLKAIVAEADRGAKVKMVMNFSVLGAPEDFVRLATPVITADPDLEVRREAIAAAVSRGRDILPFVQAFLRDPDENIRAYAQAAIDSINNPQ
jgi:hypothetical protein